MPSIMSRALVSFVIFAIGLLTMGGVSIGAWDAFVNGKLYYCTDGGSMDFIFVGDWIHHPESVSQVVPGPMDQPDEIKSGWSFTGLWGLWSAFVFVSVLLSALFAWLFWRATDLSRPKFF
jgi:chromate transport protein ChrA